MACLGQSLSSLGHRPQGVQRTGSAGRASGACSQSISAVQTTIKRRNHKHHSSLAAKAVSGQPDQPPMARTLDGPGFDAQVLAILQNSQGLTVAGLQAAMASSNKNSSLGLGALTAMLDRLVSEGQVVERSGGVYTLPSTKPPAPPLQRAQGQSSGPGDIKPAGSGTPGSNGGGGGERGATPDAAAHTKPHPLAATLEGPVMELLKRYPSVRLERLYNVLVRREDSVGLTTSDLRGLLDSMCSDGRVSYTNELYSLNVGRQHTPVGSRAPDSAPANDSQPESKPGGGGSDSPAQGMSVVVIRGGVGADTPGAPAGANTPAPGASSSTPGAIAAPGASPAGASAAPLSKSERMRQVALRTNALKRLEKDFAAGKMSTSDFADQASAIEAEFAAKLGASTSSKSAGGSPSKPSPEKKPPGSSSSSSSTSSAVPDAAGSAAAPSVPGAAKAGSTTPVVATTGEPAAPAAEADAQAVVPPKAAAKRKRKSSTTPASEDLGAGAAGVVAEESGVAGAPAPAAPKTVKRRSKSKEASQDPGLVLAASAPEGGAQGGPVPAAPKGRSKTTKAVPLPPPAVPGGLDGSILPPAVVSGAAQELLPPEEAVQGGAAGQPIQVTGQVQAPIPELSSGVVPAPPAAALAAVAGGVGQGGPGGRAPGPRPQGTLNPRIAQKVLRLRGVMAEVQTLLSDLESKREEFERKPAEERAKYEADVQQTRATLAQVRSVLPRLLKEAGHLAIKRERSSSSFRPPGEMSPEPFGGPTASGSFDEAEVIMMAGIAAVPATKRSSSSNNSSNLLASSAFNNSILGARPGAGAPLGGAQAPRAGEFAGAGVGGGVVVRTPQGSGGAEQELNRMQETMDGLQELLHKDLEAAELEMQREFESLLQGRGAWGDVASAREAEDEGEDEDWESVPMSSISWTSDPPSQAKSPPSWQGGPVKPGVARVQLALACKAAFGEILKVVGSCMQLGSWSVEDALLMSWTPGHIWVAELVLPPGRHELKAVVYNPYTRAVCWEEGPVHVLEVPSEPGVLRVTWPTSEEPFLSTFQPASKLPPPGQRTSTSYALTEREVRVQTALEFVTEIAPEEKEAAQWSATNNLDPLTPQTWPSSSVDDQKDTSAATSTSASATVKDSSSASRSAATSTTAPGTSSTSTAAPTTTSGPSSKTSAPSPTPSSSSSTLQPGSSSLARRAIEAAKLAASFAEDPDDEGEEELLGTYSTTSGINTTRGSTSGQQYTPSPSYTQQQQQKGLQDSPRSDGGAPLPQQQGGQTSFDLGAAVSGISDIMLGRAQGARGKSKDGEMAPQAGAEPQQMPLGMSLLDDRQQVQGPGGTARVSSSTQGPPEVQRQYQQDVPEVIDVWGKLLQPSTSPPPPPPAPPQPATEPPPTSTTSRGWSPFADWDTDSDAASTTAKQQPPASQASAAVRKTPELPSTYPPPTITLFPQPPALFSSPPPDSRDARSTRDGNQTSSTQQAAGPAWISSDWDDDQGDGSLDVPAAWVDQSASAYGDDDEEPHDGGWSPLSIPRPRTPEPPRVVQQRQQQTQQALQQQQQLERTAWAQPQQVSQPAVVHQQQGEGGSVEESEEERMQRRLLQELEYRHQLAREERQRQEQLLMQQRQQQEGLSQQVEQGYQGQGQVDGDRDGKFPLQQQQQGRGRVEQLRREKEAREAAAAQRRREAALLEEQQEADRRAAAAARIAAEKAALASAVPGLAASKQDSAAEKAAVARVAAMRQEEEETLMMAQPLSSDDEDEDEDEGGATLSAEDAAWRREVASRMLAELKALSNELAAGTISRAEFEALSARLRAQWDEEVLRGRNGSLMASSATSPQGDGTSSATSQGVSTFIGASAGAAAPGQQQASLPHASDRPQQQQQQQQQGALRFDASEAAGKLEVLYEDEVEEESDSGYSPFADWDPDNYQGSPSSLGLALGYRRAPGESSEEEEYDAREAVQVTQKSGHTTGHTSSSTQSHSDGVHHTAEQQQQEAYWEAAVAAEDGQKEQHQQQYSEQDMDQQYDGEGEGQYEEELSDEDAEFFKDFTMDPMAGVHQFILLPPPGSAAAAGATTSTQTSNGNGKGVMLTVAQGSVAGLRGGGNMALGPPVSPLGWPVPPEIEAIRPGHIFEEEVLRAALMWSGVPYLATFQPSPNGGNTNGGGRSPRSFGINAPPPRPAVQAQYSAGGVVAAVATQERQGGGSGGSGASYNSNGTGNTGTGGGPHGHEGNDSGHGDSSSWQSAFANLNNGHPPGSNGHGSNGHKQEVVAGGSSTSHKKAGHTSALLSHLETQLADAAAAAEEAKRKNGHSKGHESDQQALYSRHSNSNGSSASNGSNSSSYSSAANKTGSGTSIGSTLPIANLWSKLLPTDDSSTAGTAYKNGSSTRGSSSRAPSSQRPAPHELGLAWSRPDPEEGERAAQDVVEDFEYRRSPTPSRARFPRSPSPISHPLDEGVGEPAFRRREQQSQQQSQPQQQQPQFNNPMTDWLGKSLSQMQGQGGVWSGRSSPPGARGASSEVQQVPQPTVQPLYPPGSMSVQLPESTTPTRGGRSSSPSQQQQSQRPGKPPRYDAGAGREGKYSEYDGGPPRGVDGQEGGSGGLLQLGSRVLGAFKEAARRMSPVPSRTSPPPPGSAASLLPSNSSRSRRSRDKSSSGDDSGGSRRSSSERDMTSYGAGYGGASAGTANSNTGGASSAGAYPGTADQGYNQGYPPGTAFGGTASGTAFGGTAPGFGTAEKPPPTWGWPGPPTPNQQGTLPAPFGSTPGGAGGAPGVAFGGALAPAPVPLAQRGGPPPQRRLDIPEGLLPGQVLFTVSMYLEDCGPTEVLRFVGGRPEFGAWSPEAAPLCTAPRTRTANGRRIGVWEARVPLWPGYYQYKPVVLDTATGEAVWEPGPMRTVTIPELSGSGLLSVSLVWGEFEMEGLLEYEETDAQGYIQVKTQSVIMEATTQIDGG